jgi:aminopeptidase N
MLLQTVLHLILLQPLEAQTGATRSYTRADTLRGTITPERAWWDVTRYDIKVKPDYNAKTITGSTIISYKVTSDSYPAFMQIDLQEPLIIDSVVFGAARQLQFSKEGSVWMVNVPKQRKSSVNQVEIFYHGKVKEAARPPWDGGWTFTKDASGRPWMTVTCQGLGASIWFPCKDHQSDEPDQGASLTMIVPDTLVGVGNGRLEFTKNNGDGTTSYKWNVVNPINNYCIIPYIGKYVRFDGSYPGEKGKLDLGYWVLDYNLTKAKAYLPPTVDSMLKAFEHWFGPYPFYEDGFQLVDVPHTGMEHQSAVAYGNHYNYGYRGRDGSGTGWGMKWDFIVVHESGHEWFGNNITSKDLADMWIHEGFTNYSETLYVDYFFGKKAGDEYNAGTRRGIRNDRPIIPPYNVNAQGSGDMYPKSGNMLHAIRHSMDNDDKFRKIMRGLNKTFYHQTVNAAQVQRYISKEAGYNYDPVFKQYLTTTQVPEFEYYFDKSNKNKVYFRWKNCIQGFNLPLVLKNGNARIRIVPTESFKSVILKNSQAPLFDSTQIRKSYYVNVTLRQEID